MFVIFGWEKTIKTVETVLSNECYHCKNHSKWSVWKETEWVSFFFIKMIPFLNRYYLACNTCNDSIRLANPVAKQVLNPAKRTSELHDELVKSINDHQFKGMTETQIRYWKSKYEEKNTA